MIDCGADFRLEDAAAWEKFYGSAARRHLAVRPARAARPAGQAVAAPGGSPSPAATRRRPRWPCCPRFAAGLTDADDVVIVAASGPSGAGQGPEAEPARRRGDGLGERLRRRRRPPAHPGDRAELPGLRRGRPSVSFTPALAPMRRGILATCTAPLRDPGLDRGAGVRGLREAYADEPFVHLLPEGQWPQTQSVLGANTSHMQVAVDAAAGRLVVVAALDNLTKGTAGGAVQSMNIALGLPETTGLPLVGVAP